MSERLTREQAAVLLEVTLPCQPGQLKRAYRRLARQHHPDRGGDARRFHELQAAYQRLAAEDPAAPSLRPGRPSRTARTAPSTPSRLETDTIHTDLEVPQHPVRLSTDLFASALARTHPGAVHPVRASSRAPGAVLNRLAGVLAPDLTSHLSVTAADDDRGVEVVTIEVLAGTRRARRVLDTADLDGLWIRRRRSTSTTLSARLAPSGSRHRTAATTAAQLNRLLRGIAWPLEEWTLTVDGGGST
ncbi:MAG: J domain-containing protein [Nitriliruptoraceae bacterium]